LQQFLRIIKPLLHLGSVRAQSLRCHLHGGFHAGHHRIFAHEPYFVHANAGISFERRAQLFGQRSCRAGRTSRSRWECADEARQRGLGTLRGEHDAGDPRAGYEPSEALLRCRGFQRHAVQVELVAVRSEQQAASALSLQDGAQFIPCDFELRRRARMAELIQPRELQQNIQAADEGARCGGFSVRGHAFLAVLSEFLPVRLR
jgi:hypothetical protein